MLATIRKSGGFFIVRNDGVQYLGPTWPSGAMGSFARRKSVSVFARDRVAVDDGFGVDDQIDRAREEIEAGRVTSVAVARSVGRFGDSTLYERAYDVVGDQGQPIAMTDVPSLSVGRETKTVHLQISKAAGRGRRIEGFASTPNVDRDFDVVEPTAFAELMPKFMQNPVMLWMHDATRPAGKVVEFEVREKGLWIAGEIVDEEVWKWIDAEVVRALSASFYITERKIENVVGKNAGDPPITVRRITKAELIEVSVVTIPSNRESLFAVAKSLKNGDDLICRGCSCSGSTCECAETRAVVEHRPFKFAGSGPVDMRRDAIADRGGREADRISKLIDASDGHPIRHHGVQDGELVTSIDAVMAGMVYLVNYADASQGRALTEPERMAAWKHLSTHVVEAGMEAPEPPKGPQPERTRSLLGESSRGQWSMLFSSSKFKSADDCGKWLLAHGCSAMSPRDDVSGWKRFGDGGNEELEGHAIDDGIRAVLYRRAVNTKTNTQTEAVVPPETPAAPAVAATESATKPATVPVVTPAPVADPASDLVEVDSDDFSILEHADVANAGDLYRAVENTFDGE
jgi:HK97 family phage prohead protease